MIKAQKGIEARRALLDDKARWVRRARKEIAVDERDRRGQPDRQGQRD